MSGLERITARRVWFVPDVIVYGSAEAATVGLLAHETTDGQQHLFFSELEIGDDIQYLTYDSLIDHRGNHLPATIESPRVLPRTRTAARVFITGQESDTGFGIAREPNASGTVTADLLIMEMGR
ncbi:hypothetical protein GF420_07855 [candidate division GN15 bacterium]|nr:hypothetical protein [candidate division GN15 bacterium]